MAISAEELDAMQREYRMAVDAWIAAIRNEEALASVNHNTTEIDKWESAADAEEQARNQAKDAKKTYEGALRQEFFNF